MLVTQNRSNGDTLPVPRSAPSRRRGRPRDPTIEKRVFEAALDVYSEVGWKDFTFNAVSLRANVGKSALYRRWSTPDELLVDAIAGIPMHFEIPDTGGLREDLISLATQELEHWLGPYGPTLLRMNVDALEVMELNETLSARKADVRHDFTAVIRRAKARGELPKDVHGTPILNLVLGPILSHFLATSPERRPKLTPSIVGIEWIVDVVLAGLRATAKTTE